MPGPLNMDALFEANHSHLHGAERRIARAKFDPYSGRAIKQSLQQMVMGALHEMGGQRWLVQQGQKYPVAFMGLISKYIGVDAKNGGEELKITVEVIPGGVIIREDAPGVINSPLQIRSRNIIEADETGT